MVIFDYINKYKFINTSFAQLPSPATTPKILVDISQRRYQEQSFKSSPQQQHQKCLLVFINVSLVFKQPPIINLSPNFTRLSSLVMISEILVDTTQHYYQNNTKQFFINYVTRKNTYEYIYIYMKGIYKRTDNMPLQHFTQEYFRYRYLYFYHRKGLA